MKYDDKYYFPPRPKNAVPERMLKTYSNNRFLAEPKLNGSNASIYTNGKIIKVYNRHNGTLTNYRLDSEYILNLYNDMKCKGWLVLNGEYLNKSQTGSGRRKFNHELVLFDILVYNDEYLVGTTFEYRYDLLKSLVNWKQHEQEKYLWSYNDKIHLVKAIKGGASEIWEAVKDINIFEGVVLKKCDGKLELGRRENNTSGSQIKIRKATKNYEY